MLSCNEHVDTSEAVLYKFFIALTTACLVVTPPGIAIAETDTSPYIGIQYATGDVRIDGDSGSFSPTTLVARVGKYYRKHYSLEGRLGIPLRDDSKATSAGETNVGLFGIFGVYGTARVTLLERYSIYGIAGISAISGEVEVSSADRSDTDTGISYGAGMDIGFGNSALNLEYISYLDESSFDFDAFALGLKITF